MIRPGERTLSTTTKLCSAVILILAIVGGLAPLLASDRPILWKDSDGWNSPWFASLSRTDLFGIGASLTLIVVLTVVGFARRSKRELSLRPLLIVGAIGVALTSILVAVHQPPFETRRYHAELAPRRAVSAWDQQYVGADKPLPAPVGEAVDSLDRIPGTMPVLLELSSSIAYRFEAIEDRDLDDATRRRRLEELAEKNCRRLAKLETAWFAPVPHDPDYPDVVILEGPSSRHWLGTDAAGNDLTARLVHGARTSIGIATLATLFGSLIGLLAGAVAGYCGGVVDWVISRLIEAFLCLPMLFLLILLAAYVPEAAAQRAGLLVIFLAMLIWTLPARLVRAEVLKARRADFVLSARALGASTPRILQKHILPHALTPLLVSASFTFGGVILVEAALSFLGVGLHGLPSWGQALRDARETSRLSATWHLAVFPGLAVFAAVFSFNQIGDALRDRLDPRQT